MDNGVNSIWEILKIVLPAIIVFLTAYFLFRDMLENSQKQREFEFRVTNSREVTPVRLQAYERLALLLERISPQSLLMRVSPNEVNASDYHQQLLSHIRQEFEHNFSQQIYVSAILWETIRGARENLIGIINKSAEEINDDATALTLSKKIIENYIEEENQAIVIAMNELKKEVGKLF
ncbi:MAG: hypothetical protein NTY07_19010 [Bacteroidia bacterium]|nr:hypothetical protein [Bacteroidia bacterium]